MKDGAVIGVIFTEVGRREDHPWFAPSPLRSPTRSAKLLTIEQINEIRLSFHVFPEDWVDDGPDGPDHFDLASGTGAGENRQKTSLGVKRLMDIAGSLAALLVCLPLILIASHPSDQADVQGARDFRQVRLGQYGKKFTFLKFRSMYVNNNQVNTQGIRQDSLLQVATLIRPPGIKRKFIS